MRKSNEQSLSEVIDSFLKENNLEEKYLEKHIENLWPDVMGNDIALQTHAFRIKDKRLIIKLSSSVIRGELNMRKQEILQKLSERINPLPIEEILIF
jgi:predicted nucleic acid-binding Zn ribbon protein